MAGQEPQEPQALRCVGDALRQAELQKVLFHSLLHLNLGVYVC